MFLSLLFFLAVAVAVIVAVAVAPVVATTIRRQKRLFDSSVTETQIL